MNQELVRYDAACKALAAAKNVDEVKEIRDKSIALKAYAKQAQNKSLEIDATEIRIRAERRLGEMLIEQKDTVGMATGGEHGGRSSLDGSRKEPSKKRPTLADAGIDKKLSSRAQKIASVPKKEFDAALDEWRDNVKKEGERVTSFLESKGSHVANNGGNNEWYTPPKFIEIARTVMGTIDCDPASCSKANEIVRAKKFYSEKYSGLSHGWGGNIWMNPPYAQPLITDFCKKVVSEIENGNSKSAVVLVNNATETEWGQCLLSACSAVCFISKRVKFMDSKGNESGAPLQGQCLFYFGKNVQEFKKQCKEVGQVLKP